MKRALIYLVIGVAILSFAKLLRWAYLQDRATEQLLYDVCIERGCTEAECKLFAVYPGGSVKLHCNGGNVISRD